jgi:hypothetical protein
MIIHVDMCGVWEGGSKGKWGFAGTDRFIRRASERTKARLGQNLGWSWILMDVRLGSESKAEHNIDTAN